MVAKAAKTAPGWANQYTQAIAQTIRRHRAARDMSTQQLADACERLGLPIPRAVLSNLENGRRADLTVTELLVIARALGIPPMALLFPGGAGESVEMLPGEPMDRTAAVAWIAGLPSADALTVAAADLRDALMLVEMSRTALARVVEKSGG